MSFASKSRVAGTGAGATSSASPFVTSRLATLSTTLIVTSDDAHTNIDALGCFGNTGSLECDSEYHTMDNTDDVVVWQSSQNPALMQSMFGGKPRDKVKGKKEAPSMMTMAGPHSINRPPQCLSSEPFVASFDFETVESFPTVEPLGPCAFDTPRALAPSIRKNSNSTPSTSTLASTSSGKQDVVPVVLKKLKQHASKTESENFASPLARNLGVSYGAPTTTPSRKPQSSSSAMPLHKPPLRNGARGMDRASSAGVLPVGGRDQKGKGRSDDDRDPNPAKRARMSLPDSSGAQPQQRSTIVPPPERERVVSLENMSPSQTRMPPPPIARPVPPPPVSPPPVLPVSVSTHNEPPMLPPEIARPPPKPRLTITPQPPRAAVIPPPIVTRPTAPPTVTRPAAVPRTPYQPAPSHVTHHPPPSQQFQLSQSSQFQPSQATRGPPVLGMRRPTSLAPSGSHPSSQTPITTVNGLPTQQRPFRVPRRTKSTLSLFDGVDFNKVVNGTAKPEAIVQQKRPAAAVTRNGATANGPGRPSTSFRPPAPAVTPALTRVASMVGVSPPGSVDSGSSHSSSGSAGSPAKGTCSTVGTSPESQCVKTPEEEDVEVKDAGDDDDDDVMLQDDPNDSSFGDVDFGLDMDALVDACSKYD